MSKLKIFTQLNNLLGKLKSKRFYLTGLIIPLMLMVLVLVGAMCGKDEEESRSKESIPFQGKKEINQITQNKIRDLSPRVSGDGKTIIFWRDTDKDNYWDTLVLTDPDGREKKTIKVRGDVFTDKFGIEAESLDIDHNGTKVVFIGTPFVENWRLIDSMPSYFFVLDLNNETARKIDPHDLPEKYYPPEVDAERAWPSFIKISPDGSKIAFTADITGVDFGERHDVPEDDIVGVVNSDGTGLKVLEKGINGYCLAIDDSGRVFFARTTPDYKWVLTVADFDGGLESGQSLGIEIKCPTNREGLSVSKNGKRISGTLYSEGIVFVANDQGEIIAQRRDFPFSMITGDGARLLGFETKMDLKPEQRGLIYYDIDNGLEQEGQVLDMSYGIHGPNIDVSYSGGVVATGIYDKEDGDEEIVTITWE